MRAAINEQAEFIIDGSDVSRGLSFVITNFDTICLLYCLRNCFYKCQQFIIKIRGQNFLLLQMMTVTEAEITKKILIS